MAYGSDIDFYGSYGSQGGASTGYLSGLVQPWQRSSGYVGASSYIPQSSVLPATAAGFMESYIPELSGVQGLGQKLTPEINQLFQDFRFGENAYKPGGAQEFADLLLQRQDVQGLLGQQQLREESTFMQGVAGNRGLGDIVSEQFGAEDSMIKQLYGATGFGAGEAETDIRRFIAGQESGLGNLSSDVLFGGRGQHTTGSRQAVLAQLLGDTGGLVDVGGGRTFNPYSMDLLSDEYQFNVAGGLSGHNVLNLGGGILSTQDAGITRGVAEALGRAGGAGFGGKRGYRLQAGLQDIAGSLDPGETLQQSSQLQGAIDQWYQGLAGGGWGRGLQGQFLSELSSQGLA